jgi:hypothetical protein
MLDNAAHAGSTTLGAQTTPAAKQRDLPDAACSAVPSHHATAANQTCWATGYHHNCHTSTGAAMQQQTSRLDSLHAGRTAWRSNERRCWAPAAPAEECSLAHLQRCRTYLILLEHVHRRWCNRALELARAAALHQTSRQHMVERIRECGMRKSCWSPHKPPTQSRNALIPIPSSTRPTLQLLAAVSLGLPRPAASQRQARLSA